MIKNQNLPQHGLLIVNKPSGMTSTAVINKIKWLIKIRKAGHTGTLDPIATGVLPICFGQATRIAQFLLADQKIYETTIKLGVETDTHDADGQVKSEQPVPEFTEQQIEEALAPFRGEISQVPPIFSALRVNGVRAYELARRGEHVELEARTVTVHKLTLLAQSHSELKLFCHVSKGTYIRAIIRDLGRSLGCGAHMTQLKRVRSGPFSLEQAISLEQLEEDPSIYAKHFLRVEDIFAHLPMLQLDEHESNLLKNGCIAYTLEPKSADKADGLYRAMSDTGQLLALVRPKEKGWKIERGLAQITDEPAKESSEKPLPAKENLAENSDPST